MSVPRRCLRCMCFLSVLCGVVVPLLLFIHTSGYEDLDGEGSPFMATVRSFEGRLRPPHERKPLDYSSNHEDMQYQVEDLQRIVVSVRNELRKLEQERNEVRKELDMSRITLSKVRKEVGVAKSSLQESKGKLAKALREVKRVNQYDGQAQQASRSPVVVVNLPGQRTARQVGGSEEPQTRGAAETQTPPGCTDELCFDYSRCPLTSKFTAYVYNQDHPNLFDLKEPGIVPALVSTLETQGALATAPEQACVLLVVTGPLKVEMDSELLHHKLSSLPHWNGGTNHVVLDLAYHNQTVRYTEKRPLLGQAVMAKSYAGTEESPYHILLPPVTRWDTGVPHWHSLPPLLPGLRRRLVVFEGWSSADEQRTEHVTSPHAWLSNKLLSSLREAIVTHTQDSVLITTNCSSSAPPGPRPNPNGEWLLCGSAHTRAQLLSTATFSLVLGSQTGLLGPATYARLVEALRYGAVPVIVGVRHLPFDSVIDWSRAALRLPPSSLGQLHYILRNIDTDTILQYRQQGRFLWDTYLHSPLAITSTVLALVRQRALHPPPPAPEFAPPRTLTSVPGDSHVLPSLQFRYNFTSYSARLWNSPPGPFHMYPTTPFKPVPVSGSQYVGLSEEQVSNLPQHVVAAGGITGPFFEDYLLGNRPDEQFTVVMLTYERNEVLLEALGRLKDLDYLAKVVVVWNSPKPPPPDMKWPDIGVAVDVVSVERNSLNNRFLPFSNIETEAVLSIDDDVHLRHDEIQFAFRVWREARERVVGFPGRFHAWDTRHPGNWLYNSNYTCELSMVLTGAAFIHKYYMFLYSQWLYPEARALVDQHLNCEDVLMNFLVSHITRRPPLKVTSRWTFRCPGCPETLSNNDEHFNERHVCINEFVRMFGYIPLLYTQFRLDSVLFKTRLPSHLEKCYEFV